MGACDTQLGAVFSLAGHYSLCHVADALLGAALGLAGHSLQMTSTFHSIFQAQFMVVMDLSLYFVLPPFCSMVSHTDL